MGEDNRRREMAFMLTPNRICWKHWKRRKTGMFCNSFTMFRGTPDPCFKLIRGNRIRGTNSYDQWGTSTVLDARRQFLCYRRESGDKACGGMAEVCEGSWPDRKMPEAKRSPEAKSKYSGPEKYLTMVGNGNWVWAASCWWRLRILWQPLLEPKIV